MSHRTVILIGDSAALKEAKRLSENRRHRLIYARHRERQRQRGRAYRQRNREKEAARQRAYRAANREKVNATHRALYWKSERRREYMSCYHRVRNAQFQRQEVTVA